MAEPVRRSALEGHAAPGTYGADRGAGPGVTLGERRPSAIMQIHGAPPEPRLTEALSPLGALTLMWTGPGQWLAVSHEHDPSGLRADLAERLDGTDATVTDLSHARTVVRVAGPAARDLLAKGCPADVDALRHGECVASMLGHLNALIHCTGDEDFDVYVFRSFGLSLWEWLEQGAGEFGYRIEGAPEPT